MNSIPPSHWLRGFFLRFGPFQYTCCLLEEIGRETKQPRGQVIEALSGDLDRIYSHADVFHCEPLKKVALDFIERDGIPEGSYDVLASARYSVPDVWEIGKCLPG